MDIYKIASKNARNGHYQVLLNALINMRPGKSKSKKEVMRAIEECVCLNSFERSQLIDIVSFIAHNKKESIEVREAAHRCLETLETANFKINDLDNKEVKSY